MILILREQIMCTIILLFLSGYYVSNKVRDKGTLFLNLTGYSLVHNIFDIITTITINNLDIIPEKVNWVLHYCLYVSLLAVVMGFFNYILHITRVKVPEFVRKLGYMPFPAYLLLLYIRPVLYIEGSAMNYAYGPMMFWGYGIFMLYCIAGLLILVFSRSIADKKVKRALIPMIMAVIAIIVVQAFLPELSMTSGILTLICIAMFVGSDNPDKEFKEQAQWDYLTKLKSRNCYDRDLEHYIRVLSSKPKAKIGFVVADMNYLKMINDTYGHSEGDKMLVMAGEVLRKQLKSAENVYRLGGDEFVAIYLLPKRKNIEAEIVNVRKASEHIKDTPVPLHIAIGYAEGSVLGDVNEIFNEADKLMYENKKSMKEQK